MKPLKDRTEVLHGNSNVAISEAYLPTHVMKTQLEASITFEHNVYCIVPVVFTTLLLEVGDVVACTNTKNSGCKHYINGNKL